MRTVHIVLVIILLCSFRSLSQTLIGFSADLGNRVDYESNYSTKWLSSPLSVSGTLYFLKREEMRNDYYLQYGVGLGVHGHKIRLNDSVDTIYLSNPTSDSYTTLPNYHTIFGSLEIGIGKIFRIRNSDTSLGPILSAGVTHYFISEFSTGFSRSSSFNGPSFRIFETKTINDNGNFKGFIDLGINVILFSRVNAGLHYRYHFKESFRGSYKYSNTPELSEGNVVVYHRVLLLKVLYDLRL